jgi:hypothetical protein
MSDSPAKRVWYLPVVNVEWTVGNRGEWADRLEDLLLDVGEVFARADPHRRAAGCVRGLSTWWRLSDSSDFTSDSTSKFAKANS